jgi:tetratricopeptide (TPR) repeat protein
VGRSNRSILVAVVLVVATLAVYAQVRHHEFLNYDDNIYLIDNPLLHRGLSVDSLSWAFTTDYAANWFPLTWLSFLIEYELHGLSPSGVHGTNLLLHLVSSLLLFHVLAEMTGSLGRSAFVAGVFALHPLHVESVAWATERKDTLSGLFWMLTLWAYLRYAARPAAARYALVVLALGLGLMAKPMLVTLPCVLLLLDFWPLRRLRAGGEAGRFEEASLPRLIGEKLPLLVLAAASCAITLQVQQREVLGALERLPLGVRLWNLPLAYAHYIEKALWPRGLAVFYPHPGESISLAAAGLAGLLVLLVSAGVLSVGRRRGYAPVGWFWFLGTLVPVIGLVQVGGQALADRYTYLPLIGLAILVAWGARDMLGWSEQSRRVVAGAGVAALAALAVVAWFQVHHWRDSIALFEHALRVTRGNYIAHTHLGLALLEKGRDREGIQHYRKAVTLRDDLPEVVNNLAWILATHPDPELVEPREALSLARRAIVLTGSQHPAVLDTLAAAYAAGGNFPEAVRVARKAITRARAAGNPALERQIRLHLSAYRTGTRFRERAGGEPEESQALPR